MQLTLILKVNITLNNIYIYVYINLNEIILKNSTNFIGLQLDPTNQ
jgi:hypothetical protein